MIYCHLITTVLDNLRASTNQAPLQAFVGTSLTTLIACSSICHLNVFWQSAKSIMMCGISTAFVLAGPN